CARDARGSGCDYW
nr:immunoglobulin heavy chain junction region [Macaca mulatta]